MATNYPPEKPPIDTNTAETKEFSATVQNALKQLISNRLGKAESKEETLSEALKPADIKGSGFNIVNTTGGVIDLSKVATKDLQNLLKINVTGNQQTDITIKNNNFSGVIAMGDGDGKVNLVTNKSVVVETGTGNDSVSTGSGADSVVISAGNDTVKTGSGNDRVVIKSDFDGKAIVDGGTGTNTLILSGVGKITVDAKGNFMADMDTQGSSVGFKNFKAVVLGNDPTLVDIAKSKASMSFATGTGNDTITLGSGSDTIVVAGGNDSINTGAGVDIVKLASNFKGTLTLDGGAGSDKLDLSANTIQSVEKIDATRVTVTLDDGSVLNVANIENFIYDSNGDLYGGITTVGVNALDKLF
jgi:Ca2+-binding RTX toxin-like protein